MHKLDALRKAALEMDEAIEAEFIADHVLRRARIRLHKAREVYAQALDEATAKSD